MGDQKQQARRKLDISYTYDTSNVYEMSGGDTMNQYNKIKKIVEKNNGIIYAKDIEKNNINRYYIRELEKQGFLQRNLNLL